MEFLLGYLLFLAKLVTAAVIILIVFGIIFAAAMRGRTRQGPPLKLKITHINKRMKDFERQIKTFILPKDQAKKLMKQAKKEKKAAKKQKARPVVYVVNFVGDVEASKVNSLSNTISAVLSVAKPNQEVVLKLESSGGYVHTYGLAAAQLLRLKEHKINLTVCVDKVAASGGYLMAAMADKVLAAPFAIIGSIGVVGLVPNVNRLLKKGNIDVEYHTSGEYKRTLTVVGKNDAKGRKKFQEDLKQTHRLFKDIVKKYRPSLSIPKVATGEVWYGSDALKKNLIDEVMTSDEYIMKLADKSDLYEISVVSEKRLSDRISQSSGKFVDSAFNRALNRILESRIFNL